MILFSGILLALSYLIIWKVKTTEPITNFLSITGSVMIVFSLITLVQYDFSNF